jgi:6-pyruvoyl-tetrahydropterin synthase
MKTAFSIRVYKQYFNFACSHFLVFENGTREPLHGHNYRVQVKGEAPKLTKDLVFDFLDIKPIIRKICNELDHKLILPTENPYLKITPEEFKIGDWIYAERQEDDDWRMQQQPCVFLDMGTNKCTIYPVRPDDCAGFPHLTKTPLKSYIYIHKQNIEYCPATYRFVEKMMERIEISKD